MIWNPRLPTFECAYSQQNPLRNEQEMSSTINDNLTHQNCFLFNYFWIVSLDLQTIDEVSPGIESMINTSELIEFEFHSLCEVSVFFQPFELFINGLFTVSQRRQTKRK
jgi:hypothetical protein